MKKEREILKWAKADYSTIQRLIFEETFPSEYSIDLEYKNLKFNNEKSMEGEFVEQKK